MPRPKPKKGQPRFSARHHSLSDGCKHDLIRLLHNNDPAAIKEVEKTLGFGIAGDLYVDEALRPADYVRAFKPIAKRAMDLLNALRELKGHLAEQLERTEVDRASTEKSLETLKTAADNVIDDFSAKSSKGARRNDARGETIRKLRLVFRRYYRGNRTTHSKSGPFGPRTAEGKNEFLFVEAALIDARIISVEYKDLRRLFRDPRCALPEERLSEMNRLSKKSRS